MLLAAVLPLSALELDRIEYQYELRRIGVDASDLEGSVEAVWTHALGIRVPLNIFDRSFQLVPGISFTSLYYFYDEGSGRAVPTDLEWRQLTTIVPLLETSLRWNIRESGKVSYSLEAGAGLELPVPIKSWESTDTSGEVLPSLYSGFRFFRPVIAVQAGMPFLEKVSVLFRLSAHFPVHHLWDNSGVGFMDGLMIGLSAGCWFK